MIKTISNKYRILLLVILMINLLTVSTVSNVSAQSQPTVNAILFYSPSCGHCHKVITEDFPPLIDEFGDQLMIIGIDVSIPEGQALYIAMHDYYKLGEDQYGVPALAVGNTVLIGSLDIPEQFPTIIENGLAAGGIDWPPIPGLAEIVVQADAAYAEQNAKTAEAQSAEPETITTEESAIGQTEPVVIEDGFSASNPTLAERFKNDLIGNIVSVVVLIGMVGIVGSTTIKLLSPKRDEGLTELSIWVFILSIIGLFVASYLAYVELTHTQAVCGPVGDCNTVQQSEYAKLFGILPIGVFGIAGYIMLLACFFVQKIASGSIRMYAIFLVWAFSLFGTLFSIYLTFLEPFVIGATCAWCITSALVMTALLVITTPNAKAILDNAG